MHTQPATNTLDVDVLCAGFACHDLVFDMDHHPDADEKVRASSLLNCGGGLASNAAVFRAFVGIGGARGWPSFDWAWQLRGIADRLVGGVGLRRGRRDPDDLRVGEALDFWRVEAVEPDRLLRLRAEMKVPGEAWLQFEAQAQPDGRTLLVQTAFFAPRGLWGLCYWYLLYPVHGPIFSSMIRKIGLAAESRSGRVLDRSR